MTSEANYTNRSRGGARRGAGRRRAQYKVEKPIKLSIDAFNKVCNLRDRLRLPTIDGVFRVLLSFVDNCK
jgi:hypothetical protein